MRIQKIVLPVVFLFAMMACIAYGQETLPNPIPKGSKVFIAPMENGFHEYLKAAIQDKKVPVAIVEDKSQAEFEISGHSETQKAGKAKKIIRLDWHSNEQASIQIADLKSGIVVFAYSVNKTSSAHGKKSTAGACAKHIKEKIESAK
jgi:hypothetical protein